MTKCKKPLQRVECVSGLVEKYESLVWLAREGMLSDSQSAKRIRKEYPQEVEEFMSSKNPDWQHGFNSGCLAAFRLVSWLLEDNPRAWKTGEERFPELDA